MPITLAPIDSNATQATKNLYANLHQLRKSKTIFGHHDSLAYGVGWTADNPNGHTSDVYDSLAKKNLPGIFGWDIGEIETGNARLINWVEKAKLKQWIKQVHQMGCVNTVCWHVNNPVFGGSAFNTGDGTTVAKILDGISKPNNSSPTYKDIFKGWLNTVASFFTSLKADDGSLIPIIFRPFHECNLQNCFWWDANHCTATDYIKLWRFTVTYLKDVCGVHNLLYAFSLNDGFTLQQFTARYPDNGFVDIIGLDAYQRPGTSNSQYINKIQSQTDTIIQLATDRNKLPAITEMGCNNLANAQNQTYTNWFTQTLLPAVKDRTIAYFMIWRNPKGAVMGDPSEFYCCYPTHATQTDFNIFFEDPEIIFSKSTGRKNLFL